MYTGQLKQKKNVHLHPCLEWDLDSRAKKFCTLDSSATVMTFIDIYKKRYSTTIQQTNVMEKLKEKSGAAG
jgi:hypothetical protein